MTAASLSPPLSPSLCLCLSLSVYAAVCASLAQRAIVLAAYSSDERFSRRGLGGGIPPIQAWCWWRVGLRKALLVCWPLSLATGLPESKFETAGETDSESEDRSSTCRNSYLWELLPSGTCDDTKCLADTGFAGDDGAQRGLVAGKRTEGGRNTQTSSENERERQTEREAARERGSETETERERDREIQRQSVCEANGLRSLGRDGSDRGTAPALTTGPRQRERGTERATHT